MSDSDTDDKRTVAEIEADLEATRQQLGETIDAIGDKLDVKGRAKQRASDVGSRVTTVANDTVRRVQDTATDDDGNLDPKVLALAAAAAFVVGTAVVLIVRRRR